MPFHELFRANCWHRMLTPIKNFMVNWQKAIWIHWKPEKCGSGTKYLQNKGMNSAERRNNWLPEKKAETDKMGPKFYWSALRFFLSEFR